MLIGKVCIQYIINVDSILGKVCIVYIYKSIYSSSNILARSKHIALARVKYS